MHLAPLANGVNQPANEVSPPARRSRARLRRNAAPRTRVRRFERRVKETARRLIREPSGRVEPAGVEPVAANQARLNLSHYRQTAYLSAPAATVTRTVTPL
jgi:hypothetical protein